MRSLGGVFAFCVLLSSSLSAQTGTSVSRAKATEKIIIDTDIGDDIDDAFAVGLALSSPEFQVLGFSASFGDTPARAKMLDRMLGELGHSDIPVVRGVPVNVNLNAFTQRRYAEGGAFARPSHADA